MSVRIDMTLPPADAVAFFRPKGLDPSFSWMDMLHQEHDAAFTVAKMMDLDLLRDMQRSVDDAIAEGMTFQEFRKSIEPTLVEAGWWGKAEMVDPVTGETKLVQLGSTRRLETIFRTNIKTSYAAGHWAQIVDQASDAPYLMYDAVDDGRTRPEHAALDGLVLPADDPFWERWFPPNGWGCRCSVIQIDQDQLASMGKSGPDAPPPTATREWVNPRTGEVHRVPVGIDPGWDYHPGRTRTPNLRDQLSMRVQQLAPDVRSRARAAEIVEKRAPVEISRAVEEGRRISDELLQPLNDGAPATAAVVRERISQRLARDVGSPLAASTATKGKAASMVREAGKSLPRDWLDHANKHGPLYVRSTTGRGWQATVGPGQHGVTGRMKNFGRVTLQRGAGYIVASSPRVALHELVHRVQHVMPEIDDLFQQLHVRRTSGKPLRRLSSAGPGYSSGEMFRDGGYISPYMGKEYADSVNLSYRGRAGALELMAMSMEYVLMRAETDFARFRDQDRELFDLTMWVLFRVAPGGPR